MITFTHRFSLFSQDNKFVFNFRLYFTRVSNSDVEKMYCLHNNDQVVLTQITNDEYNDDNDNVLLRLLVYVCFHFRSCYCYWRTVYLLQYTCSFRYIDESGCRVNKMSRKIFLSSASLVATRTLLLLLYLFLFLFSF